MPPNDVPFEDLSKMDTNSQHSSNTIGGSGVNLMTSKGTVTANKLKKRVGIFGIFGSNKVKNFLKKFKIILKNAFHPKTAKFVQILIFLYIFVLLSSFFFVLFLTYKKKMVTAI